MDMDADTLEILMNDFVDDVNAGEYPRIFEYIEDHPHQAALLKEMMMFFMDFKIALNDLREKDPEEYAKYRSLFSGD
jgi:hypothetical protein